MENSIFQTVEAEITAMMPLQRTCGAESQVRNKLSNGPLRAQSNVVISVKGVLVLYESSFDMGYKSKELFLY